MKISVRRTILALFAVVVVFCCIIAIQHIRIQNSYYPLGGLVTVIGKDETNDGEFTITIQEKHATFVLSCTKEQFCSVDIGDTINCERYESVITNSGRVVNIK